MIIATLQATHFSHQQKEIPQLVPLLPIFRGLAAVVHQVEFHLCQNPLVAGEPSWNLAAKVEGVSLEEVEAVMVALRERLVEVVRWLVGLEVLLASAEVAVQ
tara:strand:+ start:186 stop:491 length:306 start_codon:yes stop_codon:yes gene_type:complete